VKELFEFFYLRITRRSLATETIFLLKIHLSNPLKAFELAGVAKPQSGSLYCQAKSATNGTTRRLRKKPRSKVLKLVMRANYRRIPPPRITPVAYPSGPCELE
jgi:hypothetical protein